MGDSEIFSYSSSSFSLGGKKIKYYSLPKLRRLGIDASRLPFSIRVVLESLIRNIGEEGIVEADAIELAGWNAKNPKEREIPFKVSRILMQDFTGVPAIVDLAAMRNEIVERGGSAELIEPVVPVDLIIDHSVQVDSFGSADSIAINQAREISRNNERYSLLKWASGSMKNFRVFPPSAGICHQINLEYLAKVVVLRKTKDGLTAFPDTLVGTDSHTTMVNALGVLGFGVGGIEAEAALLNQPVPFVTPRVLGVKLEGELREGVTATDFALTLTRMLREKGVVNMFVEFFGDGVKSLSLPDRATLSNMCPEYGATVAIFPIDEETLRYMNLTCRPKEQIELVKRYYSLQGMMKIRYDKVDFSDTMEIDLESVRASVSGPSQPKQRIPLEEIRGNFIDEFIGEGKGEGKISSSDYVRWASESMAADDGKIKGSLKHNKIKSVKLKSGRGEIRTLSDGDVVISSITSCTNTSNPSVMIAAGLLAKKAVELGLRVDNGKVKTSLGPGSRVVTRYLEAAKLIEPLSKLGYNLVGYGCITCIGNSGPLIEGQSDAINNNGLAVAAVLSGNRNYQARIHKDIRANYLMSPPLLIAFAIAGTVLKDLTKEPLGVGKGEKEVYLKDIWPRKKEIDEVISKVVKKDLFRKEYGEGIFKVNKYWNALKGNASSLYAWDKDSSYIRRPPFFSEGAMFIPNSGIRGARVLAVFGDSVSTDHISPAGEISPKSPAGRYLKEHGVREQDFNTYGSRRGNHEIMMRGTFANDRIRNMIVEDEGGYTLHFTDGAKMSIFDAAMKYKRERVSLIVIAGKEYGSGSSRDWAAKGPMLLGVKAIIAKSFERIHRSNLIGMGILPLQFAEGDGADELAIDPSGEISIELDGAIRPNMPARMIFRKKGGRIARAEVAVRLDSELEVEYYKHGGILNYVLNKMLKGGR
jgi:aconitate hydratase